MYTIILLSVISLGISAITQRRFAAPTGSLHNGVERDGLTRLDIIFNGFQVDL